MLSGDDDGLMGSVSDLMDGAGDRLRFLKEADSKNLWMVPNAVSILSRPSMQDWLYNSRLVTDSGRRFVDRMFSDPDRMNDFQMYSAEDGFVSTPEDGILAGVTERGRMSALNAPHTGFTHQVPYFVHGDDDVLEGSKPREGGFLGLRRGDEVSWLWEDGVDHEMGYREGSGVLDLEYRAEDLAVDEQLYVMPGDGTVVRDFTVRNESDERIDTGVYYMQANANDNPQYSIWNSDRNHVEADGNGVRWAELRGGALSSLTGGVELGNEVHMRTDADVVDSGVNEGSLEDLFDDATDQTVGRYVGGFLEFDLDLDPGEETELAVFIDDDGRARAEELDREDRLDETLERWEEYHDDLDTSHMTDDEAEQYIRSLNALMMISDPESGSISAAPNLQPSYYPSWVRDSAFNAYALALGGQEDAAKRFLADFCTDVQEPDGSFRQCYDSRGESAGIIDIENDQQPLYIWAVRNVYELTGDEEFLEEAWPAVEAAADYTVGEVAENGLLNPTHDFAEMPHNIRQSLWTNALAYRGLHDAAELAEEVGADPGPYREVAGEGDTGLSGAMQEHLFDAAEEDPFYTKLTFSGPVHQDNTAHAAAVHPADWAEGEQADELLDAFWHDGEDGFWLPSELMYAAALYGEGRHEEGDMVLDRAMEETRPSGNLAEQVEENGSQTFASLGWSQAMYINAIDQKYEESARSRYDG